MLLRIRNMNDYRTFLARSSIVRVYKFRKVVNYSGPGYYEEVVLWAIKACTIVKVVDISDNNDRILRSKAVVL